MSMGSKVKKKWGTSVEQERRRRILVALWAYAYEFKDDPLASDGEFDKLAKMINPEMPTENDEMDEFFRTKFSPHTGQWIHAHPYLDRLEKMYNFLKQWQKEKAELCTSTLLPENQAT